MTGSGRGQAGPPLDVVVDWRHGSPTVVTLTGELDIATAPTLQSVMTQLLSDPVHQPVSQLVLDLRGLAFIDSIGISVLVRVYRELRQQHGTLRIHCVSGGPVENVLVITKLDTIIDVIANANPGGEHQTPA